MCTGLLRLLSRPSGRGEPESSLNNGRFGAGENLCTGAGGMGEGAAQPGRLGRWWAVWSLWPGAWCDLPVLFLPSTSSRSCRLWSGPSR